MTSKSQPEFLTVQDHGQLGINASAHTYAFAKTLRAIPIAAVEVTSAQRNYPVIFSDIEQPSLLAVVGVLEDRNLFVEQDGQWDKSAYIPAYARCYPFSLVARPEEQYAVAIDRAAPSIAENAELPFFEGKDLTPQTQARVDFCVQFDEQLKATRTICNRLAELQVLSGQEVTYTPKDADGEEHSLGSYVAVDFNKLNELDTTVLHQLHIDGTLATVYAHRFSLDLWLYLLDRHNLSKSSA